ncbi:MAG: DUF4369 domain-containing protein [Prevotellaceae bacterium]|nr:DUF4369 domain-containing protein [Prevotellaceae bacterium]
MMNKTVRHIALAAGLLTLASCTTMYDSQYSVTGTSSQSYLDGNVAYIRRMDRGYYQNVDSCEVIHGNFQMSGPLDSVMCVSLVMGSTYQAGNQPILVVLEQGDVKVNIDYASVRAGGTPLNDILYSFLATRDSIGMMLTDPALTQLEMMVDGYSGDAIRTRLQQVERANRKVYDELHRLDVRFVEKNYDNVLGVTWFLQMCDDALIRTGTPVTPQIRKIYNRAPESFKQNPDIRRCMMMFR